MAIAANFAAEVRGVQFVSEIADDIPTLIVGDGPRLQQILRVLLSFVFQHVTSGDVFLSAKRAGSGSALSDSASAHMMHRTSSGSVRFSPFAITCLAKKPLGPGAVRRPGVCAIFSSTSVSAVSSSLLLLPSSHMCVTVEQQQPCAESYAPGRAGNRASVFTQRQSAARVVALVRSGWLLWCVLVLLFDSAYGFDDTLCFVFCSICSPVRG